MHNWFMNPRASFTNQFARFTISLHTLRIHATDLPFFDSCDVCSVASRFYLLKGNHEGLQQAFTADSTFHRRYGLMINMIEKYDHRVETMHIKHLTIRIKHP